MCSSRNGPPKEPPPQEIESEIAPHDKKPPSGSKVSKRVSSMRPDTGESNRKAPKKKSFNRSGVGGAATGSGSGGGGGVASPQPPSSTLPTMLEDQSEGKAEDETAK